MTEISIENHTLKLLPERAVVISQIGTLIVSDLHLANVNEILPDILKFPDLDLLADLVTRYEADNLVISGDLLDKRYQPSRTGFDKLKSMHPDLKIKLGLGNHDTNFLRFYDAIGIEYAEQIKVGPFLVEHFPRQPIETEGYLICGHMHPAIQEDDHLLPAYVVGSRRLILPPFGSSAYLKVNTPLETDQLFVIDDSLVKPI